jgi:transposase
MEDPLLPLEGRQWRRFQALKLHQLGWLKVDIAQALGVSRTSVHRWLARVNEEGSDSLCAHPIPGRSSRLSIQQKQLIPEFLSHGAEACGFRGEVWTCARVGKVIEEEFAVPYHKDHVGRLLKELHWTPQVPIKRAIQRNEEQIEHWRKEVWPELQEQARDERRTLLFEDESGFYLLPGVVRTYAPQARTPVIHEKQSRDHLSVMGAMTREGKIYTLVRQESLNGLHCIELLEHLTRVAGKRLLVIWDGSPIHRRAAVRDYVKASGGNIRLEALPGYAPDLNPWDEGGWNHLKNIDLRNRPCRDLEELHQEFHLAIARLRQRPKIIKSFFAQAGLKISCA